MINYMTVRTPFGFVLPNGMNFGSSVTRRDSNLQKVLRFIGNNPPVTRREILSEVFDVDLVNETRFGRSISVRGWNSNLFSGMIKGGFVTRDSTHRFHLTDRGGQTLEGFYKPYR